MIGTVVLAALAVALFWIFRPPAREFLSAKRNRVTEVSRRIQSLLSGQAYIRSSRKNQIVADAISAVDSTRSIIWRLYAGFEDRKIVASVKEFTEHSKELVNRTNKHFVDSELARCKEFFDTVENAPLTQSQRRACVINEDRNLVLAGAGTGKTSTMVGRAAYLIAGQDVPASDILMLAYNKKAAAEMQERMEGRIGQIMVGQTPKVKTFHALGLEILGIAEGRRPSISPMAEDETLRAQFVDRQIDELSGRKDYRAMLVRYLGTERFPCRTPFDFDSMPKYLEYVREHELRALDGMVVKSFEEVVIANFLSAHSVVFNYEQPYQVDTAGPDFRQYLPDFFLPQYGIYIEHFALDRSGHAPPHFGPDYIEGVEWKRALHRRHGTKLIETYSFLKREGRLESHLAECLRAAGVRLVRISDEELLERLRDSTEITQFSSLLANFLALVKESGDGLHSLEKAAVGNIDSSRIELLLALSRPVFLAYEAELARNQQIDFADMIRRATEHIENSRYLPPYSHILVDEFQDMSKPRARLLLSLMNQCPASVLFAVGDDWQSIYRFTGSDIAYTRDFEKFFGATATTTLDKTFRFNDRIGKAASTFVLQNPAQIRKTIQSQTCSTEPSISLVRIAEKAHGLELALRAIVERSRNAGREKSSVLVLGRYNFNIDEFRKRPNLAMRNADYPSVSVDFMTVHSAKGREADFVVVLGLARQKNGFPSRKRTDALLEFLLPENEPFPFAEERRLFYVALTRARQRVYLVYDPEDISPFVLEMLQNQPSEICKDEFDPSVVCEDAVPVNCPICRDGLLVPRSEQRKRFIGCSNFPYCDYTEKPCPRCHGIMLLREAGKTCTNPACDMVLPICPKCGGSLVERKGPSGRFLGCSNYRRNSDFSCNYTMNGKKIPE